MPRFNGIPVEENLGGTFGGVPVEDEQPRNTDQDGALKRGWNKMIQSVGITGALATGDADAAAQRIAEAARYQQANPGTPEGNELMAAWQRGDGISGGLSEVGGEFKKDWREAPSAIQAIRSTGANLAAMGSGVVEQVPNMILPMAGMIGGGVAGSTVGPVGTVGGAWAGASTGNTLVEGGGMAQEALHKAGINPLDTEAVKAYLAKNGDTLLAQAGIKGAVIGAVDTATMGIAGKLLTGPAKAATGRALVDMGVDLTDKAAVQAAIKSPELAAKVAVDPIYKAATTGAQGVARNVTAAALEPAGEFTGEYLGQGLATGEYDEKEAFLEAASSIGQSGATFAGQKAYAALKYPFKADKGGDAPAGSQPGPSAADVLGTPESAPAAPTEAEKALYTPKPITALDRVAEIDAELTNGGIEIDKDKATALQTERDSITESWPKATPGAETSFTTEAGARLDGQYALIEAGDLTTSHDESLRPVQAYPAELQPRERERHASEMQIQQIVQKLDPARLGESADVATGAPIVGADGLVESGNARTIALKRIYQANGQKALDYKAFIKDNSDRFGITPESVDAMQNPVLVRVRNTPVNRAEFARQANQSTVARMSPSEQARSDAAQIDSLEDLNPTESGDFSSGSSAPFIRRFMAKLPATEQAGLIDSTGQLSQAGYQRIRNAVLAKAYGDSPVLQRMVESLDSNIRNVGTALLRVAPHVAKTREAIDEGALHDADITPDLMAAVEELSALKDKGTSVTEALAQAGMFGDKLTPESRELLAFMDANIRSPKRIADFIQSYLDALAAAGNPVQGSMFGDTAAPAKVDLIAAARRIANGDTTTGGAAAGNTADGQARGEQSEDPQGNQAGARGNETSEWLTFPPDTGTLGIPRAEMPQIKGDHRGALIQFLQGRGISHETVEMPASELKPAQAEFSVKKVEGWKEARDGVDRSVLASSDGYILDGHHQWVAALAAGETEKVIRFDVPIQELLAAVREFPSVKKSEGAPQKTREAVRREVIEQQWNEALGDLGAILRDFAHVARMVPEDTPNLMPTLVKLFEAGFGKVGMQAVDLMKYVKAELRKLPEFKTIWNKIPTHLYRKAADKALANVEKAGGVDGLFVPGDSKVGADDAAMIDGRPYDMARDNYKPPKTDTFIPADVLSRARDQIKRLLKEAAPPKINDVDRKRAAGLLRPMIEKAEAAKVEFDQKIIDIAKKTGALGQMLTGVKAMDSAVRKLVTDPNVNFDTSQVFDLLRSTIVVKSYADAQAVVDAIRAEFNVIPGRIKNQTDQKIEAEELHRKTGFLESGYGQILVNADVGNGVIAEIQINVPEMLAVKLAEGHDLYEIDRAEVDGSQVKADAISAQQKIYGLAAEVEKRRADFKNDASLEEKPLTGIAAEALPTSSPDSSDSLNTRPSGNLTQSPPSESLAKEQPAGNLSGTFISNTSDQSVVQPDDEGNVYAAHAGLMERLRDGTATLTEFKSAFEAVVAGKDAIKAELSAKTKDALFKQFPRLAYRYKNDKKADIVDAAYRSMLDDFVLGDSIQWSMGDKYENTIRGYVERTTDDDLRGFSDKVKAAKEERAARQKEAEAGMASPVTLDDYKRILAAKAQEIGEGATFRQARMAMTPEQRARFDELTAEQSRGERKARADQQRAEVRVAAATTEGQIVETKHTKTGEPLFVVKPVERVDREIYGQWSATAKKLSGWYSSFRGNGAVPGFQFKTRENAEAFLKYLGGDVEQAKEAVQARRDAFSDDRGQTAVERLNEMADRLEAQADEALSADRKTNTARRASMAASAEAAARGQQAMAQTMRNIAAAIESGKAKFLDRVRQKIQIERIQAWLRNAQYAEQRAKYPTYAEQQKHEGEPPTAETADYAKFPDFTAYRSDLARMGRRLAGIDGAKQLSARLLKVADDVTAAYKKFAKENLHKVSTFRGRGGQDAVFRTEADAEAAIARSGYKGKATVISFKRGEHRVIMGPEMAREAGLWQGDDDKRITLAPDFADEIVAKSKGRDIGMPYTFETISADRARLKAMGIETPAEFRALLREFVVMREAPKEEDRVKKMEREMIGRRNDGLDFFPTPAETAQAMIDAAELDEGMTVLEPSAGWGHIAEMVRDSGVDPDVVELSGARRELLEAKGFNVIGNDFMDVVGEYDRIIMNPPFSGRRDAQHVEHAYSLLRPGGRLVAIMGEGVFFGQDKKAQQFREWLESVGGTSEKLADGSFLDPSLPVNTGVNARMVVIDKPAANEPRLSRRDDAAPPAPTFAAPEVRDAQGRLLAPNGKPSKLNERQWHQVRSPQFRKWFGDWEKHAKADNPVGSLWSDDSVSKVVDANGEPLVVHHGTKKGGFDAFDTYKADQHRSPMIFTAATRRTAASYSGTETEIDLSIDADSWQVKRAESGMYEIVDKNGEPLVYISDTAYSTKEAAQAELEAIRDEGGGDYEARRGVYSVFLNIRNPLDSDMQGGQWDGSNEGMYELIGPDGDFWYAADGNSQFTEGMAERIAQEQGWEEGDYELRPVMNQSTNQIAEEAKQIGHDGVIIRNVVDDGGQAGWVDADDVFVFFDDYQVKSATQNFGEFSVEDRRLRFSRGAGRGMALRDLQAVADRMAPHFKNMPRVHVLESPASLSTKDPSQKALRDFIRKSDAWHDVEGATHDGEIYLFASGMSDEARAEHVLATHEITHYGLRGAVGAELDAALQSVWMNNAKVRKAAAAVKKARGLKSNVEAIEEVLADMPSAELAKLTGWRAVVKRIRNWLKKAGAVKLAAKLDAWINAGLTESEQADLFVADLVSAAREWVKTGKGRAEMRGTRLADPTLADDMARQEQWLAREAKARGYQSIDELAEKNYQVFENLAALWRKKSPVEEALLSRKVGASKAARSTGFDKASGTVVADFKNDNPLKAHVDYKSAKAGDVAAAARLVQALVKPESIEAAKKAFGDDVIYVPVHAEEASGRNKIPGMLAHLYSDRTGGSVDLDIMQANRAFHTGANAMERLLARAEFSGDVELGGRYVLVDDVTTMGGTLADLASYIRSQGGEVAGSVVLVNAMRGGMMTPISNTIRELEARHGDEIRKLFGIEPGALTANESQYLLGFRTTDELRARVAKARRERGERLRAKGVSEGQDSQSGVTRLSRAVSPAPTSGHRQAASAQNARQRFTAAADRVINRMDAAINGLGGMPDQRQYLAQRYRALGRIAHIDEIAGNVRKAFKSATADDKKAIYAYLTTRGAVADGIKDANVRDQAKKTKTYIGTVGDELVKRGLIPQESREEYRDRYLPRLYLAHLLDDSSWRAIGGGKKASDMGYLKQRNDDLPEEYRKVILGEVTDPAFLAASAIAQPMRDMAILDWLQSITTNTNWIWPDQLIEWGGRKVSAHWLLAESDALLKRAELYPEDTDKKKAETVATEMRKKAMATMADMPREHKDYKRIPDTPRYGQLRGLMVRREIYDDLVGLGTGVPGDAGFAEQLLGQGGIGSKATQLWKTAKVALNPPGQIRNIVSNLVMLQLSGVPLHRIPSLIVRAYKQIQHNGVHWQAAKKYGMTAATFTAQELYRAKRDVVELEAEMKGNHPIIAIKTAANFILDKAGDVYQWSEAITKTVKMIDAMEREGMTDEQAALEAQKWLFDYSLVDRNIRYLRNAPVGMPFLTYSTKVAPRLVEIATKHPQRFLPWAILMWGMGAAAAAMLGGSDDDWDKLKETLPEWLRKNPHAVPLPWRDADGRVQFTDIGYFFPWSQWAELGKDIAHGEPMGALSSLGIFGGPVPDIITAAKTGIDPFTKRPIADPGDPAWQQGVAIMNYVWSMAAPPFLTANGFLSPMGVFDKRYGGKLVQGITGTTDKYGDSKATVAQSIIGLGGVNIRGIDPDHSRATELQRLQLEAIEVKRRLNQRLNDKSLSDTQRAILISDYTKEMRERMKKMQQYSQGSSVPAFARPADAGRRIPREDRRAD